MSDTFFHPDAAVHRIEYSSDSGKRATVLVDGMDISRFVTKIEFRHTAGSLQYPTAFIELKVRVEEIKIDGLATISYTEEVSR